MPVADEVSLRLGTGYETNLAETTGRRTLCFKLRNRQAYLNVTTECNSLLSRDGGTLVTEVKLSGSILHGDSVFDELSIASVDDAVIEDFFRCAFRKCEDYWAEMSLGRCPTLSSEAV